MEFRSTHTQTTTTMSDHTALIRQANQEIIVEGKLSNVSMYFDESYCVHASEKDYGGHDFIKQFVKQLRRSIDNISLLGVRVLVSNGDLVAWQRSLKGTFENAMRGIPASGNSITWHEQLVSKFVEGKIVEEWVVSDLAGQLMLSLSKK